VGALLRPERARRALPLEGGGLTVVLACGSQGWDRPELVGRRLAQLPPGSVVVHGQCPRGADLHVALHCRALGIEQRPYAARWSSEGADAGWKRNRRMLEEEPEVELVLAFWDGFSPGTKDMIDEARRRGLEVEVTQRHPRRQRELF